MSVIGMNVSVPPTPSQDHLAALHRERLELVGENKELQQLIIEAQQLCQRAEIIRSRPASAASKREEETLIADGENIRKRAIQCTSRPTSAGSSRVQSTFGSRPSSASGWKKPLSRPASVKHANGKWQSVDVSTPASSSIPTSNEFKVELDRSGGASLGMKIRTAGTVLEVTKVKEEGLATSWNEANPMLVVQKGDKITEVNGKRGDADELFNECTKEQILCLLVQRTGIDVSTPASAGNSSQSRVDTVQWCETQIRALLEKHDVAVLANLDKLLEKFKGREASLYESLCKKYGEEKLMPGV
mmetsp:Transcript_14938/g.37160  ORF Transcript_14938/g.37160 Transcript_14938/m.37160 type:complete len:302 (+) Transcript_14938:68-973(+)